MSAGKLVHIETGNVVNIGDKILYKDGRETIVLGWRKPHKLGSTGRIFVKAENDNFESSFFPNVFSLKIIDYED